MKSKFLFHLGDLRLCENLLRCQLQPVSSVRPCRGRMFIAHTVLQTCDPIGVIPWHLHFFVPFALPLNTLRLPHLAVGHQCNCPAQSCCNRSHQRIFPSIMSLVPCLMSLVPFLAFNCQLIKHFLVPVTSLMSRFTALNS